MTSENLKPYSNSMNKRMTIDIPEKLHKRFKKASVDLEKHMRDIMIEHIERFVEEHEKGQEKEAERL